MDLSLDFSSTTQAEFRSAVPINASSRSQCRSRKSRIKARQAELLEGISHHQEQEHPPRSDPTQLQG